MKKILLLIITLFLTTQITKAQTVVLDANGVTVKWTGTTVPSPYFFQASPRGTLEWFAIVDNTTKGNITNYANNLQSGITYFTPTGQSTPIPFNNIVTTLVTNMVAVFGQVSTFNQPIGTWDVGNVTNMQAMFVATAFNQPIGSWNVSNVTYMNNMFLGASAFNQPIGSWDVSNVKIMSQMFQGASSFNQPLDSWNVSKVTDMHNMFASNSSFNQPLGSWNVGNVTNMSWMFGSQLNNTLFNQDIGSWNINNVANMSGMFYGAKLSTANYDATLIGWSTISPNETPLQANVTFDGGNSNYCNGATARNSIISTFGWTISDAGLNCTGLDTETFNTISLKLYPNPVLNILNVKVEYNLINQPYSIVDGLGRVVLSGNLNEVDTAINVEKLSKGIYYLKLSDSNASKFMKE
jgi:surface protein